MPGYSTAELFVCSGVHSLHFFFMSTLFIPCILPGTGYISEKRFPAEEMLCSMLLSLELNFDMTKKLRPGDRVCIYPPYNNTIAPISYNQ